MSFEEIYRVIFAGVASVASLVPVAQLVLTAKTGVWSFDGTFVYRADNPRAFRRDLWFDGAMVLVIVAMAVLMWTLPADGGFRSPAVIVWAVTYMHLVGRRSRTPWVRKRILLIFILSVLAVAALSLVLDWLGL
jgi:hypothetical protein